MNTASWIILGIIILLLTFAVISIVKGHGKGCSCSEKCSGDCCRCIKK